MNVIAARSIERRSKQRYPVRLNIRYRSLDPRSPLSGTGRSLNVGSGGLLVDCEGDVRLGMELEVILEWPSLLNDTTPLQLVTAGRVVRCEDSSFAVEFSQYEFRTMRRRPLEQTHMWVQSA